MKKPAAIIPSTLLAIRSFLNIRRTYICIIALLALLFSLSGCSKQKVTNQEVTIESLMGFEVPVSSSQKPKPLYRKVTGTYTGEINSNNQPDGLGEIIVKNPQGINWTYDGEFSNGRLNGKGKQTWDKSNLDREGTFKDGIYQGDKPIVVDMNNTLEIFTDESLGKIPNRSKDIPNKYCHKSFGYYTGEVSQLGIPNGYGIAQVTSKDSNRIAYILEGNFYEGFLHGNGKFAIPDPFYKYNIKYIGLFQYGTKVDIPYKTIIDATAFLEKCLSGKYLIDKYRMMGNHQIETDVIYADAEAKKLYLSVLLKYSSWLMYPSNLPLEKTSKTYLVADFSDKGLVIAEDKAFKKIVALRGDTSHKMRTALNNNDLRDPSVQSSFKVISHSKSIVSERISWASIPENDCKVVLRGYVEYDDSNDDLHIVLRNPAIISVNGESML